MFGAGGGTSSYEELENTDLIILWGSNARDAHPIIFHHMLRGIRSGTRLIVVDPRRTSSAEFADLWLGLDVGSDIALANCVGREIIAADLHDREFIQRATTGFDAYREAVEPWTPAAAEEITGVPADAIIELAHTYGEAASAQLCWTLGITEHHNAVDNVFALTNLALLTGHVGRYGSGLCPLRGQNNVQGGGDMGALPNKLPGFADVGDPEHRQRFEAVWGSTVPPEPGLHLTLMFEAMETDELRALYVIGENPADSEADALKARSLLAGLDHLVVQDLHLTATAQLADVVLPAAASFAESEGTVTSSERRVQRMHPAVDPPGDARPDLEIIAALANALGADWGEPDAEVVWDELRSLSEMHRGMSYARLEELGGIQWPCLDEDDSGRQFLHARLWEEPVGGQRAPFQPVEWVPPADELTADFPLRLTTGRRLDSFNTGVQSGVYQSPTRQREGIELSAVDAAREGLADGDRVSVISRRGTIEATLSVSDSLVEGLAFMTMHSAAEVDTNTLLADTWDPKSGTAEFKATAIRVERIDA